MRRALVAILFLAIALFFSGIVSAAELTVEKEVGKLTAGSDASVVLKFENPWDMDLPVRIVDKNIIGNSGLDIQCLEAVIPAKESEVEYEAFKVYDAGEFKLGPAEVHYTHPNGSSMIAKSEEVDVKVKGESVMGAQSVSTIFQCDGQNMRSTSMTMSSQQSQEQQQQQQSQQQTQQDQMQQKMNQVKNNQMDQDAGALKQEMAEQREEYEQMMNSLAQKMQTDSKFSEQHQKMLEQGYQVKGAEIEPETNDTGDFKVNYEKEGETASLSGRIENGTVGEMSKRDSALEKQMMESLAQDPQFQQMSSQLASQGFNQTSLEYELGENVSQMKMEYSNAAGETAEITAEFSGTNVTRVEMEVEEKKVSRKKDFLILLVFVLIGVALYLLYRKRYGKKGSASGGAVDSEKPINHRKEAKKMLAEAKKKFEAGEAKDAYELVGRAVRFYHSYELGYRRELTNVQTVNALKGHKAGYSEVQKCLNMCGMVEFAKYKANKKDFDTIYSIAETEIK
ncbi:hypothetical protein KY362_00865 [Candidatus Woesearchaeota archaeon]|nr:hypothetical protein [Candidatus Woesearchaeota archaeon]